MEHFLMQWAREFTALWKAPVVQQGASPSCAHHWAVEMLFYSLPIFVFWFLNYSSGFCPLVPFLRT